MDPKFNEKCVDDIVGNQINMKIRLAIAEAKALPLDLQQLRAVSNVILSYHETIMWIAAQQDLFFAECRQAEEIVARCRTLL